MAGRRQPHHVFRHRSGKGYLSSYELSTICTAWAITTTILTTGTVSITKRDTIQKKYRRSNYRTAGRGGNERDLPVVENIVIFQFFSVLLMGKGFMISASSIRNNKKGK